MVPAVSAAMEDASPEAVADMLGALKADEADICVASRFAQGADVSGWDAPERERLSGIANRVARRLTGVELTDPMSGYFMLATDKARALVPRLSGIGFKILLDLLASADAPMRVKEFPLQFASRRAGTSKLDRAIALVVRAPRHLKAYAAKYAWARNL